MKPVLTILSLLILCSSFGYGRDATWEIYGAIRTENLETVKTGLAADTNAVNAVFEKKWTLLHWAAEHGSTNGTQILKLLLTNGAKVDARNHRSRTPLFAAAIFNNAEGTKILIAYGAKVNARDDGGSTPLHWAALGGCYDAAKVLVANHASVNAKDSGSKTPLTLALEEQKDSLKDGDANLLKQYEKIIALLRENHAKK